jgi:hypothetical protein
MFESLAAFKGLTPRAGRGYPSARMKRLVFLWVLTAAGPLALAACAGPYAGRPEALQRPRIRKHPGASKSPTKSSPAASDPATAPSATSADPPCRTNFFGDPFKGERRSRKARALAAEAEAALLGAERVAVGRKDVIVGAMATLANALRIDPYGAEPTYKLAMAYAMVGRRSCSLALLERLKLLAQMADGEAEAARTIERAARDPAFEAFRTDARRALGQ